MRNESRAARITEKYPSVTPLIGNLDSITAIQKEVSQADVVLRKLHERLTLNVYFGIELIVNNRPG